MHKFEPPETGWSGPILSSSLASCYIVRNISLTSAKPGTTSVLHLKCLNELFSHGIKVKVRQLAWIFALKSRGRSRNALSCHVAAMMLVREDSRVSLDVGNAA
ncbi:hypothetical protein CORC01_14135 [Colletotrichum orchidophilum]|uniref:Uncharacterized protein n=1 Tax=Colletotrichum orchidophilum TaxID=1209926 RepID=A0A1G4AMZ6_9PEZI|nr:uncharacterized protein CORC01_14135 [Colletotrichum orchidophilum]OHE90568.1 hypothetical protein CORC01_14135 [Colletotrichum orchidophilum]